MLMTCDGRRRDDGGRRSLVVIVTEVVEFEGGVGSGSLLSLSLFVVYL